MKNLFWTLFALILLAGTSCQDKQTIAELNELKSREKLEEQNKSIVHQYWDGKWNERRPEVLDELLTEDIINHGGTDDIHGIEEYRQVYGTYLSAMENTRFEIKELIAEGDRVMSRAVIYGIYNGSLGDIYPVGEELSMKFFTVFRMVDGKIAEEWELFQ